MAKAHKRWQSCSSFAYKFPRSPVRAHLCILVVFLASRKSALDGSDLNLHNLSGGWRRL